MSAFPSSAHPDPRRAFTLIELLVVTAVIGILVALLLAAVQRVREAANRVACQNNLKQLGLTLQHYHDSHGGFPPAKTKPKGGGHALVPYLLPYLEQEGLHRLYNFDTDWNDAKNLVASRTTLKLLICPSAPADRHDANGRGITDYSAIPAITPNSFVTKMPPRDTTFVGVLGMNVSRRLADVTDGTSYTIMVAEDAGRPQKWVMGNFVSATASPGGAWADPANTVSVTGFDPGTQTSPGPCAVNCWNDNDVYGFHSAGSHGLFADGAVRLLRAGLDVNVLIKLVTRSQGEVISPSDLE